MTDLNKMKDLYGDEVSVLIKRVVRLWQRVLQKSIDEYNLTISQMELLCAIVWLKMENEDTTQIALSQETGIDPMTTSTIIRNMQKKGLVIREESKTDTRARIVELTEEGSEILSKAVAKIKKMHPQIISGNINQDLMKTQLEILFDNLNNLNSNYNN